MYYVYCLISKKKRKFHYYGFTGDIEKRIEVHERGKVRTTRRYLPIKLLGYRKFISRDEAILFEKQLKSKASYRKRFVKELENAGWSSGSSLGS